eukprot:1183998-Prorocentrum_minimum.AAC.2
MPKIAPPGTSWDAACRALRARIHRAGFTREQEPSDRAFVRMIQTRLCKRGDLDRGNRVTNRVRYVTVRAVLSCKVPNATGLVRGMFARGKRAESPP